MNNQQVAHLWANQSKGSAKGSNFYFEGDTIYSYGSHFPIAKIYGNTILFTTKNYSSTTAKHKSYTTRAIDHKKYTIIRCPYVHSWNKDNLDYLVETITQLKKDFIKAKSRKQFIYDSLLCTIEAYKNYCRLLKLKAKKSIITLDYDFYVTELKKCEEKQKEKEAKRELKNLDRNQLRLNKFLNNDEKIKTVDFRYNTNYGKIVGDKFVTNNGAEVEFFEVKKLSNILEYKNKNIIVGRQIGNFTINSFDEKGIKIGCHFFDNQEINRIIQLFN